MVVKLTANSIKDLITKWTQYMLYARMPGRYQSRSALYCNLKDKTYSFYLFFYIGQGKIKGTSNSMLSNRVYKKVGAL